MVDMWAQPITGALQFPIETAVRDRGMESPLWSIRGKVVKLFASGYYLLNICLLHTTDTFPFQESQGKGDLGS